VQEANLGLAAVAEVILFCAAPASICAVITVIAGTVGASAACRSAAGVSVTSL